MYNARIKMPKIFEGKSKKEIKQLIEENIFNPDKKNVAIKYYVYENCMIDIACEYNIHRNTVSNILQRVVEQIERAL